MALTQDPRFYLFWLILSIPAGLTAILLLPVMLTQQSLPLIFCQSGSKDGAQAEDEEEGERRVG